MCLFVICDGTNWKSLGVAQISAESQRSGQMNHWKWRSFLQTKVKWLSVRFVREHYLTSDYILNKHGAKSTPSHISSAHVTEIKHWDNFITRGVRVSITQRVVGDYRENNGTRTFNCLSKTDRPIELSLLRSTRTAQQTNFTFFTPFGWYTQILFPSSQSACPNPAERGKESIKRNA